MMSGQRKPFQLFMNENTASVASVGPTSGSTTVPTDAAKEARVSRAEAGSALGSAKIPTTPSRSSGVVGGIGGVEAMT